MVMAPGLVKMELDELAANRDNPMTQHKIHAKMMVRNKLLAATILSRANNELYRDLKTQLTNDYAKGIDSYPLTVRETVNLLNTCKGKIA